MFRVGCKNSNSETSTCIDVLDKTDSLVSSEAKQVLVVWPKYTVHIFWMVYLSELQQQLFRYH